MSVYVLNDNKLKSLIQFTPHENQQKIIDGQKRFTCVTAGRRFGKTAVASFLALRQLWLTDKTIWIVAPTYDLAKKTWRYIYGWAIRYFPNMKINQSVLTIENPITRSILELKTAENPSSCIGSGVDFLIIDEASRVKPIVWQEALYPTLADKKGKVFFISTPKGRGWFHEIYSKGQNSEEPDYASFSFETKDNLSLPHLAEEQEEARRTLPLKVYEQEYLAKFLDDAGQVFRGVKECINGELEDPKPELGYILGVDLAKHEDFTVVVVFDLVNWRVVGFERWNLLDWEFTRQKIKAISKKYHDARIVVDATGVGDPIAEQLERDGLAVEQYKYTNQSKKYLIENLIFKIEQKEIHYPNIPILINELEIFGYEYQPETRNIKYNAPAGFHDDAVNALALAVYGAGHYRWDATTIKQPFPEGTLGRIEEKIDEQAEEKDLEFFV